MTEQELEQVLEIERAGAHVGSGLSAVDYFMLYGTGETARREHERDEWNKRVGAEKTERKRRK